MSESWTWMGHLKELNESQGQLNFGPNGVAFIHYYARNKSKMGSLTLKTSALTPTLNDVGQNYLKQTQYASLAKDFFMKAKQNQLGIEWNYNKKLDTIKAENFDNEIDYAIIQNKLLPLFPDLILDPNFTPIKSSLKADVGNNSRLDLTMYSIWQPKGPTPDGRIRFLGVDGTFTFFHPMIIAIGTWTQNGVSKKVAGMLTLDRQWSNEYFGKSLFDKNTDLLKAYRALSYAHHWSGFHGYLPQSKSWVFVHLWNQFYRKSEVNDVQVPYSNLVWVKNGILQQPIDANEYNWIGQNFILNHSKVLLNFAEGREAYFPSQFELVSQMQNTELKITASPPLQSLEQPIYLYEGFGIGKGIWQGEPISVQGRIEASRILFRNQDYQEIISAINNSKRLEPNSLELLNGADATIEGAKNVEQDQETLRVHLEEVLAKEENQNQICKFLFCTSHRNKEIKKKSDYFKFISNDMKLKISILKEKLTTKESQVDPNNPEVIIYH